jgi:hypothetical protein
MEIIDFESKRKEARKKKRAAKKDKDIGWKCKTNGSDGTYYKFSVTYQFKGKNWEFDIWAKSKKEAELRLFNIKRFPCEIRQILDEVQY